MMFNKKNQSKNDSFTHEKVSRETMNMKHEGHSHDSHNHNHDSHNHSHDSHDHSHGYSYESFKISNKNQDERKTLIKKLVLSCTILLIFMLAEIIGGVMAGSLALISDGLHVLTDIGSLFVTLLVIIFSIKGNRNKYTYGFARLDAIGAFLNALTLAATLIYIVYEAINRFVEPVKVLSVPTFIIAVLGLLANNIVMLILHSEFKKKQSLILSSASLHLMVDLLGSLFVILASVAIYLTGYYIIDPILSLILSLILSFSTFRLMKSTLLVLMDSTPKGVDITNIKNSLLGLNKNIVDIHHIHAWSLSSHENVATMHVSLANLNDASNILPKIKEYLNNHFNITHSTIQIESADFNCTDKHH